MANQDTFSMTKSLKNLSELKGKNEYFGSGLNIEITSLDGKQITNSVISGEDFEVLLPHLIEAYKSSLIFRKEILTNDLQSIEYALSKV